MIMVLAGTLEGRVTAELLQRNGYEVLVSATTSYGSELLKKQGLKKIITGQLDKEGLGKYLKMGVTVLVDATHPFAVVISKTAMECASEACVTYLRLERSAEVLPTTPLVQTVDNLEEMICLAKNLGRVWFSTLGSKNLPAVVKAARGAKARLVVRVLPEGQIINSCLELGIIPADMIALQGPCSRGLNRELYSHYGAEVILTKESGVNGGLSEKVNAALELNLPILVWRRPPIDYPAIVDSPEQVLKYCKEKLGGNLWAKV